MGTINYCTSDYITLGLRPYDRQDFLDDPDFLEALQEEVNEYGGTLEDSLESYINGCIDDDFANIEAELKKHNFYYFHVSIEPGYYEGFYLRIENNFSIALDGWEDRRYANREITQIKDFLIACAGLGLVECWPGWCTRYNDYSGTLVAIKHAIQAMRDEVKATPTWAQYSREA